MDGMEGDMAPLVFLFEVQFYLGVLYNSGSIFRISVPCLHELRCKVYRYIYLRYTPEDRNYIALQTPKP